jgi:long-subunit acyl-CoA synthetase (AMP-forming)
MATHKFYDRSDASRSSENFGLLQTITTSSTATDEFLFDANRPFTVIIDQASSFSGSVNLQLKIDSGAYNTAYTFTGAIVKAVVPNTRNTYWKLVTSSDFSGSVTVQMSQSIATNYQIG